MEQDKNSEEKISQKNEGFSKDGNDSFEFNLTLFKKHLFKNSFVFLFSLLTFFSLLFWLSSSLGFSLQIGFLVKFAGLFPLGLWLFLALMSLFSAVLAYYEKYSLMFLPILIWLLFTTAIVRTSNIPGLINAATGEPILGPDLDPFLYLRHAIEISEGNFNKIDHFRMAPLGVSSYALTNIMPWAIFYIHQIINLFTDYSVTQSAIITPVIFFLISLIGFFFFVYFLFLFKVSKNKALLGATIASFFYAFVPAMLHRTIAGIPEIESLGMMWFWLAFLFFILAWKQDFNPSRKIKIFILNNKKLILYGLLAGLFTGAMSWAWGGYRYIYMTLALAVFLAFLFNIEKKKIFTIFSSFLVTGFLIELIKIKSIFPIISSFSDTGFALGVFLIIAVDFILFGTKIKYLSILRKIKEKTKIPENVLSVLIFFIFGLLILLIFNPSFVFSTFSSIISKLLYPFGKARIALTVAENRAPYFVEVLGNFGGLVWLFLLGVILSFYESTKHFSQKKKVILNFFFIVFVLTFIFSRISSSHILNGENFISKFMYLGGLILFGIFLLVLYLKSYLQKDEKTLLDFSKINFASIVLISFSFWGIVSMRGAVRLFFIIAPILIIVSSYFLVKISDYRKTKDDLGKMVVWLIIIGSVILAIGVFLNYAGGTISIAKQTMPSSYNQQWQYAMEWANKNTPENSIFVHWWDYGYWIQTLGWRPTVTDGAHASEWFDYTTARYFLTTSRPETALSLMKTYNVSYLLIDSTDVGKYSAFSKIGSDKTGTDRFSWIPVMPLDPSQTQKSNNTDGINRTINIYVNGQAIDADIIYEEYPEGHEEGEPIFLPAQRAGLAAIVLEYSMQGGTVSFLQPTGIFVYNNKRYDLPLRYLYYEGQILEFESGVNSLARVVPGLEQGSQGMNINQFGAVIYLSEKTKDTLFSQLYLMDDPDNLYPTISLAHAEDDYVVKVLKAQGIDLGNFIYYQGLRGPIKIWEVNYPENIIEREEFLYPPENWNTFDGPWATLDNLSFTK